MWSAVIVELQFTHTRHGRHGNLRRIDVFELFFFQRGKIFKNKNLVHKFEFSVICVVKVQTQGQKYSYTQQLL